MIPENQTLRVSATGTTVTYMPVAENVPAQAWQIFMHHGTGYVSRLTVLGTSLCWIGLHLPFPYRALRSSTTIVSGRRSGTNRGADTPGSRNLLSVRWAYVGCREKRIFVFSGVSGSTGFERAHCERQRCWSRLSGKFEKNVDWIAEGG